MGRTDVYAMMMVAMASMLVASCDREAMLSNAKTAKNLQNMADCLHRIRSCRDSALSTESRAGSAGCNSVRGMRCFKFKKQDGSQDYESSTGIELDCCKCSFDQDELDGGWTLGQCLSQLRGGEQERRKTQGAGKTAVRPAVRVQSIKASVDEGASGKRFGEAAFSSFATDNQPTRRQRALSPPSLEGAFPSEGHLSYRALGSRVKGATRLYSLTGVNNDPGNPDGDGASLRAMTTSSFKRAVESEGGGIRDLFDEVDVLLSELNNCKDPVKKRQLFASLFVKAPVGHRKAVEAACGALLDKRESISVRNAACFVISKLGLVGDPKVVIVLARAVKMDACLDIRKQALRCLASKAIKSDQTALDIAYEILRKKDLRGQEYFKPHGDPQALTREAIELVAKISPRGSHTAWKLLLCRVLDDAVLDVRLEAVRALTKIADGDMLADGGSRETIHSLIVAFLEEEGEGSIRVRQEVLRTLKALLENSGGVYWR